MRYKLYGITGAILIHCCNFVSDFRAHDCPGQLCSPTSRVSDPSCPVLSRPVPSCPCPVLSRPVLPKHNVLISVHAYAGVRFDGFLMR
jgi:hypothetical protein